MGSKSECYRTVNGEDSISDSPRTYFLALVPEVVQQVTVRDKLRDETERLLQSHAPHHVHNVVAVALGDLLHHVYLHPEVLPLLVAGSFWRNDSYVTYRLNKM